MEQGPYISSLLARIIGGVYVVTGATGAFLELFRPIGIYHEQVHMEDQVGVVVIGGMLYFIGDKIYARKKEEEKVEYLKDIYDTLSDHLDPIDWGVDAITTSLETIAGRIGSLKGNNSDKKS